MIDNPFITVITPVYNCERYIEECILSIKQQKYQYYEHIIVDGGSTDNTLNIIKKYEGTYPMKWISEKDKGMYDAINKGFNLSKGNVMSWLNADDKYMQGAFDIIANVFQKKDIEWVTGLPTITVEIDDSREIMYTTSLESPVYCRRLIRAGCYERRMLWFIEQESTFWTRTLWEKIGAQVELNYQYAGDFFLWKSFAEHTALYTVNAIISTFRVHNNQKTSQMEKYYDEIGRGASKYKIFRKILIVFTFFYGLMSKDKLIDISELYREEMNEYREQNVKNN